MSYCRFSCDNFACMLYVYESDRGYEVHVARSKCVGDIPKVPAFNDWEKLGNEAVAEAYKKQSDFLESCERKDIGLPYDGQSFVEGTLEDLLARVTMLKDVGYHVPDFVFESIKDEMVEES